jgi:ankyrin repeat protein
MLGKSLLLGICVVAALASASDSRLADAAQQQDRPSVSSLLKQKADVNAAQGDGMTALHWAASKDDLAMARMLLAAGANVKAETRLGGLTPLFMACRNGSAAMIEALLKAGADAKQPNAQGTTPLMIASASGSADAVKALLEHGADVNAKEAAHGQTALMFAAALNRDAAVKTLIAHGADAKITTKAVEPGCGSVFNRSACADEEEGKPAQEKKTGGKDAAVGKKTTAAGGKPEEPRRRRGAAVMGGMTALLFAARDGQMDSARALIEAGSNVNDAGAGEKMSPLVMAIGNGHYDLAKFLLEHGADPNLASTAGLTALYAAVDMQWAPYAWLPQPATAQETVTYLDLMKELLARGANPNARLKQKIWFRALAGDQAWVDPAGATAFWRAAQASDVAAMRLLVSAGADPKIATESGVTPLMVAAGLGWAANFSRNAPDSWVAGVKYCLELGADVNATDTKGYTALHGTAFRGDNDMVRLLVEKGAKVDAVTKAGDTVADMANGPIAHSEQHPETVALLEKLGSANSHNCRAATCVIFDAKDRKRL